MIKIDQIKTLETKVLKAIELIQNLKHENSTVKKKYERAQKKLKELEKSIESFRTDQSELENGILRIMEKLDRLEDDITGDYDAAEDGGVAEDGSMAADVGAAEDGRVAEDVGVAEDVNKAEDVGAAEDGSMAEDVGAAEDGSKAEDVNKAEDEDTEEAPGKGAGKETPLEQPPGESEDEQNEELDIF